MGVLKMRKPSITQEIYLELQNQCCFGRSKHDDKVNGVDMSDKIYSFGSYKTHKQNAQRFAKWAKNEMGAKDLKDAQKYTADFLELKKSEGCSVATLKTYASSIAKVYHTNINSLGVNFDARRREDITRSRIPVKEDSLRKGCERLQTVAKNTGLRRSELRTLEGKDLHQKNGKFYIEVKGKGGKTREVPILKNDRQTIAIIKKSGNEKVFSKNELKSENDIHAYRREYAQKLYFELERPLDSLRHDEIYFCRNDAKGMAFDRQAMREVSNALGHNRVGIIAINYLV